MFFHFCIGERKREDKFRLLGRGNAFPNGNFRRGTEMVFEDHLYELNLQDSKIEMKGAKNEYRACETNR